MVLFVQKKFENSFDSPCASDISLGTAHAVGALDMP
jgi:hypothetical protein